jgi:two-component system cell cycle sensor histidine kinase/response regulator CckA
VLVETSHATERATARTEGGSRPAQTAAYWRESWRYSLAPSLVVVLAIVGSGLLALLLRIEAAGSALTLMWPPLGVGLGIVLRFGYRMVPALIVGNAILQLLVAPPALEFVSNLALESLFPPLTALILERSCRFDRRLTRVRDVMTLAIVGGGVATLPLSYLEAGAFLARGEIAIAALAELGTEYWLESIMSVVVFSPLVLVLRLGDLTRLPHARKLEGVVLLLAAGTATWFSGSTAGIAARYGHLLALAVFPLVVTAAMRFGKAGATLMSVVCVVGAVLGRAYFAHGAETPIGHLQIIDQTAFLVIVGLAGLLIAVMLLRRIGTELLLSSTEASFRSLFEHSPIGIAIERGGVVRFVNHALLEMLGARKPADLIGVIPSDWLDGANTNRQGQARETTCRRLDGSVVPVLISEAIIPQVDGVEIVRFVTDQTSRHRLEDDLRDARRMESIGLLASGIAHDFNNILTVISGYIELMREPASADAELRGPLENVATATEKAATLTRQLLAFGRRKDTQAERLDLARKVRDFIPFVRRIVGEHVEVVVDAGAASSVVQLDPTQLDQIVLNLTVNARDAMPRGGRLTLRVRQIVVSSKLDDSWSVQGFPPGEYVVLEVVDTGVGMDEPTLHRVFEPFFTTKPAGHGTGLGLATVRSIVDRAGGYIRVQSQVGVGTTIAIGLPAVMPASRDVLRAGSAAGAARPTTAEGEGAILVVQDDPAVRRLIVHVLTREGFRVQAAASASEALTALAREGGDCDLLIADVMMPQMSGAELARGVRRHWPRIRTLFLSGYSEPELLTINREELGNDLLTKPFTTAQLVERVRGML